MRIAPDRKLTDFTIYDLKINSKNFFNAKQVLLSQS